MADTDGQGGTTDQVEVAGQVQFDLAQEGHSLSDQLRWFLDVGQNWKIDGFNQLMQFGRHGVAPTQGVELVSLGHRLAVLRA